MRVPVYDIKNCGPRHRFVANGKLVHNSDSVNMQNLPRISPLKKAILAPEGYVFIDSDSSQIEARTLAWLAGQDDLVTAFANGEDVYCIMASGIYGRDITKAEPTERFVGKTVILGCLAEGTLVLTGRGWVAIEAVSVVDRLWDGEEWVCHRGLLNRGLKETLNISGLWLTPDHLVLCGTHWRDAQSVQRDKNIHCQALATGAANSPSQGTYSPTQRSEGFSDSLLSVVAGHPSTLSTATTSKTSRARDATRAPRSRPAAPANCTGDMPKLYRTTSTARDYSTDFRLQSPGAITPKTRNTATTEPEGYTFASSGVTTAPSFYDTSRRWMDGIPLSLRWTAQTTTKVMNRGIYSSCPEAPTCTTDEKSASCRRNLMTYDLAYAGPRNRYTVATDKGPIIVHNCGYGTGKVKLQGTLKAATPSVVVSEDEAQTIVDTYRTTYEKIPELWREAGDAIRAMINDQTAPLGREGVLVVEGAKGIRLPNGLYLRYPNLREQVDEETGKREFVYDTKKGRAVIPTRLYGAKLIENVCQALARIIIGEQMLKVARRYRPVMTVHDAIAVLAPEGEADEAQAYVEKCMKMRPTWGMELPLNCEAGYGASYGECK